MAKAAREVRFEEEKALLAETIPKASMADAKQLKRRGEGVGVWLT